MPDAAAQPTPKPEMVFDEDEWPADGNELVLRFHGWWSLNYWLITGHQDGLVNCKQFEIRDMKES